MSDFEKNKPNKIRCIPKRASYSKETIYPIIDAAPICHLGFDEDGQPFVIPTIHARVNDMLYVHGEKSSMKLKQSASGITMCITVTLFDGLVVARSLFHHSMNYRSTIVFGQGRLVTDAKEKFEALMAIAENLIHGRWDEAREPNKKELRATSVVAIEIESASAKTRNGPPVDDDEDYELPIWDGIVSIKTKYLYPETDSRLR